MEKVRIDKWLWSVRLYKTRSLASEACRSSKVRLDGEPVKTSKEVKCGEVYVLTLEGIKKHIKVIALIDTRIPAKRVCEYMQDLTPTEDYERIKAERRARFERRDRGLGRPTKKERREIDTFKEA